MAPEARKSDVSQDEPWTKKGLRDVERKTATVGSCLWGGIVKGSKVFFSTEPQGCWSIIIYHILCTVVTAATWHFLQHVRLLVPWIHETRHQERCSALFDFVTSINDEDCLQLKSSTLADHVCPGVHVAFACICRMSMPSKIYKSAWRIWRGKARLRSLIPMMTRVESFLKGMHGEFLPKYDWPVHRFQNMEPLPCLLKLYHSVQMEHLLSCPFWDSIFLHSATCFTTCSLLSSFSSMQDFVRFWAVSMGIHWARTDQNAKETAASSHSSWRYSMHFQAFATSLVAFRNLCPSWVMLSNKRPALCGSSLTAKWQQTLNMFARSWAVERRMCPARCQTMTLRLLVETLN